MKDFMSNPRFLLFGCPDTGAAILIDPAHVRAVTPAEIRGKDGAIMSTIQMDHDDVTVKEHPDVVCDRLVKWSRMEV